MDHRKIMTLKAKFGCNRNDMHWSLYDLKDGFVRWSGYDDANWWNNVSVLERTRTRAGKETGRKYVIDFKTSEVTVEQ